MWLKQMAQCAAVAVVASGAAIGASSTSADASVTPQTIAHRNVPVCPAPTRGYAHCHAVLHQAVTWAGKPAPNAAGPTGVDPSHYLQAYGWADTASGRLIGTGAGQTVAVVDAYDDPTISSDLTAFDNQFGIPCTSSTGSCLTKVDQSGGTNYPKTNSGWALEISLDVEWAHAIAPDAHILLVEAASAGFSDLLAAEDYASAHAAYVTNSWGGSEFSGESADDSHFQALGVSYFASAGDTGGAVEYPSSSPDVTSVGGTTLTSTSGGWAESAWSSSGGGCSAYETANSAQATGSVSCTGTRATPDVASDADPNTGVDVYDTTSYYGQSGWFVVGGTSAASPVWAARAADRGAQITPAYLYAGYTGTQTTYGNNITYRDVTTGSNGYPAGSGYDLATGLGTWIGADRSNQLAPATNLTATPSGNSITLQWTGSTTSGASYDVYRSTTSGSEYPGSSPVASLSAGSTTWTDNPTGNGTYYYEIVAYDSAGYSQPSNEASATVGATTLPATITSTSCSGASCDFTGTGTSPLTWGFGDNTSTVTGSPVSHTYSAVGTYTVTLTAGNSSQATTTVTCSRKGNPRLPKLTCS